MTTAADRGTPAVEISKSEFDRDRAAYMRRATHDQRIVVRHDNTRQVSLVLGGSLSIAGDDDE